ncbi:MAG TPA: aldolase catalytic domain-containing protein [Fibrobacteraceae bacterium]|nr:aldolase catalytic domain-containing protein [Fibrobacteraceae bacterium]
MYRSQIKVLDCTVRDGGLLNKHQFPFELVRKVYQVLAAAGVDYMEAGYKNSRALFSDKEFGPWKFCDDDLLWRIKEGVENGPKMSVMVDIGRADMNAIKSAAESPYQMVRVACYAKDIDKCIALVNHFHDLGYETTINVMASSRDRGPELDEALDQAERESRADVVYMVDTFGYYYQEQIDALVKRYRRWIKTKELGFHGHNNQQLAFSNTIQAIINNVNYLDCTINGIGRGAGNCTTELLLGFLKNPKFDVRPILDIIASEFEPMREKGMEWGYIIPQMISGVFNAHPEEAIKMRKTAERTNYRGFWDRQYAQE